MGEFWYITKYNHILRTFRNILGTLDLQSSSGQLGRFAKLWPLFHGTDLDSWYRHGLLLLPRSHGIDMDSWYWQQLMVLSWTHVIVSVLLLPVCRISSSSDNFLLRFLMIFTMVHKRIFAVLLTNFDCFKEFSLKMLFIAWLKYLLHNIPVIKRTISWIIAN